MGFSNGSVTTSSISGSTDAALASPSDGQALLYESSTQKWRNAAVPSVVADNSVTASKLTTDSVITAKVSDGAITEPKLAILNTPSTNQILSWDGSSMAWSTVASGTASASSYRSVMAIVYSSGLNEPIRTSVTNTSTLTWVCDGLDDQTEINAAITAVAGLGGGQIKLVGPLFNISNKIELQTQTWLSGGGFGTVIRATASFNEGMVCLYGQSLAAAYDPGTHLTKLSDLTLVGNSQSVHGVHYRASNGQIFTSGTSSNPDPNHVVRDLYITGCGNASFGGHGMWLEGPNLRAGKYSDIRMLAVRGCGVFIDGAVDSHYTNIEMGSSGSGGPLYSAASTAPIGHGFYISQGDNNMFVSCKPWYSRGAGFYVRGTRNTFTGCQAQDNYSYGFHLVYGKNSFSNCQADSNGQANGDSARGRAGWYCAAELTTITGCMSYDKQEGASSSWEQLVGFQFTSGFLNSRVVGCITYGNGFTNNTGGSQSGVAGAGTTIDIASDANGR